MAEFYPIIFQLIVLLFSVVIHEVSHGAAAYRLGDPTAKLMGRLTLNPIKHLDFFGSLIMPFSVFLLTGGRFVFGWAKPVPFNPANLKNPRLGSALVALAGPLSNFLWPLFSAWPRGSWPVPPPAPPAGRTSRRRLPFWSDTSF